MNDQTIDILLALFFGFVLKVLDLIYHEDAKTPDQPLDLRRYLLGNSNKWRILSSVILILGGVFLVPLAIFEQLQNYEYSDIRIGLVAIAVMGYAADDVCFFKFFLYKRLLYNRLTRLLEEEKGHGQDKGG